MADSDNDLIDILRKEGYTALMNIPSQGICGIYKFMFTYGLVVGLQRDTYDRRYCYKTYEEALIALCIWSGEEEHPQGDWIKCKGSCGDITKKDLK